MSAINSPTPNAVVPAEPVTLVQVLEGEGPDTARRGNKVLYAKSECAHRCVTAEIAAATIEALRESDERLRARPEELMLWDWQSTWFQADPNSETGGGTVLLGVAWYDPEFYTERRDAYLSVMHKHIYDVLGLTVNDVEVVHYLVDTAQAA